MICLFLSSAGKNECPCGTVGRERCRVAPAEERGDCWAREFSWSHVQCPTALSSCSCWAGAALPVGFGLLIPSRVRGSCRTLHLHLGGCGGALACPEPTQSRQALLGGAATSPRLSLARLPRRCCGSERGGVPSLPSDAAKARSARRAPDPLELAASPCIPAELCRSGGGSPGSWGCQPS